jgi:hypothetical protein
VKVRIIDLEGPAEEIAKVPELLEAIRGSSHGSIPQVDGIDDKRNGSGGHSLETVPKEISDHIRVRAGTGDSGKRIEAWLAEILSWRTTEVRIGKSKRSSNGRSSYLLVYNLGPHHFGAFAYVRPTQGAVTFRLQAEQASGFDRAIVKEGKYGVTVPIVTDEGYRQALDLAQIALEGVQPKGSRQKGGVNSAMSPRDAK